MRLLPGEVKQKALWQWEKFEGKPVARRRWVRERTKLLVNWEVASGQSVHALEYAHGKDVGNEHEEVEPEELCSFLPHLTAGGSATRDELHAFNKENHHSFYDDDMSDRKCGHAK